MVTDALPAGTSYTETEAYVTYNNDIRIPPNATNFVVTGSCPVPALKFWTMSTHSHKQSVGTAVMDGSSMIFSSKDWQHPGAQNWSAPSFYSFTGGGDNWANFASPDQKGFNEPDLLAYTASFGGGFSATFGSDRDKHQAKADR